MVAIADRSRHDAIHPFHAVMLAGTVPLFLGALIGDYASWSMQQAAGSAFAARLVAGGLVFASVALLCAFVELFRAERLHGRFAAYTFVLLANWGAGILDALHHARDAVAGAPAAPLLSLATLVLAVAATWIGFSGPHRGSREPALRGAALPATAQAR
jgi:hypothetical protein